MRESRVVGGRGREGRGRLVGGLFGVLFVFTTRTDFSMDEFFLLLL